METHFQIWSRTYAKHLKAAMLEHPEKYLPGLDPDTVAAKMNAAFFRGSANKDSKSVKRTCRELGIRHTYKAIAAYIHGDPA